MPIDLVLTSLNDYAPADASRNGVGGKIARLNVMTGGAVELKFEFLDQRTGAAVEMESVYITFLEIDAHLNTRTEVTVGGFETYYTKNDAGEVLAGSRSSTSALKIIEMAGEYGLHSHDLHRYVGYTYKRSK